jgi:hypothetical protein
MGFLDVLRGYFTGDATGASDDARNRIRNAWGLDDRSPGAAGAASPTGPAPDPDAPSAYDVEQWKLKLQRILDGLPTTEPEWASLVTEARAYKLKEDWVSKQFNEQFELLIRSVVADRVLSEDDLARIETARKLIGISESQAEAAVRAVVADAEAFFGRPVVEES